MFILLAVPIGARLKAGRERAAVADGTATLVVITPHIEQIRFEFGRAFEDWHLREHGTPARIDWRSPGGTSDIRKQLESQVTAAVSAGAFSVRPARVLKAPARGEAKPLPEAVIDPARADLPDVFMGGGSFEHNAVRSGLVIRAKINGESVDLRVRITVPPVGGGGAPEGFSQAWLDAKFGENKVGIERLYDPDQFWFGTALSGFGIVFNRDALSELGVAEPRGFADLCDPRLAGRLALSDPRQSGSVATLYDSILNNKGWEAGWRVLQEMSANARYFTASSTQPPMDVSQGEAAAGVAIDFYGRGQAQAVVLAGQDPSQGRVGYIDPPGATYIDADPVSIINGARSPELARRFVEFCLSDEAQALWQFAPLESPQGQGNPRAVVKDHAGKDVEVVLGPRQYRLRRMPVKRSFYAAYIGHFADKTDPFAIAMETKVRGWRDLLGPLMGAMAIDTRHDQRAAWDALNRARALAGAGGFDTGLLAEMERLFYALPETEVAVLDGGGMPTGQTEMVAMTESNYRRLSEATRRWRDPVIGARAKVAYTLHFRGNYRKVVEMFEGRGGR